MNQLVISSLILEAEARIGFQFQSFKVSMERLVKIVPIKKYYLFVRWYDTFKCFAFERRILESIWQLIVLVTWESHEDNIHFTTTP